MTMKTVTHEIWLIKNGAYSIATHKKGKTIIEYLSSILDLKTYILENDIRLEYFNKYDSYTRTTIRKIKLNRLSPDFYFI